MVLNSNHSIAIIVAGGVGARAQTAQPKQFMDFRGKPMIEHSIEVFQTHPAISKIIIATNSEFKPKGDKIIMTTGGATRSESVGNCLEIAKTFAPDNILIHDAARPGINRELIDLILETLNEYDGCFPSLIMSDAAWKCDDDGIAIQSIDRNNSYRAQTPQAFRARKYFSAFDNRDLGRNYLDDVEIGVGAGLKIRAITGDEKFGKITYPQDFERLAFLIDGQKKMTRTGMGYDAHRFSDGEFVTICGHKIPHNQGLEGHSDADVAWHALVDALLGAIGDGDIGIAFPPSEAKWKNADSRIFVEYAVTKIKEKGGTINNIDLTLVCEAPKIGPHREILANNTAKTLGIALNQVNIKATTTEKMGFTGRKEGIAAYAIAAVEMRA